MLNVPNCLHSWKKRACCIQTVFWHCYSLTWRCLPQSSCYILFTVTKPSVAWIKWFMIPSIKIHSVYHKWVQFIATIGQSESMQSDCELCINYRVSEIKFFVYSFSLSHTKRLMRKRGGGIKKNTDLFICICKSFLSFYWFVFS